MAAYGLLVALTLISCFAAIARKVAWRSRDNFALLATWCIVIGQLAALYKHREFLANSLFHSVDKLWLVAVVGIGLLAIVVGYTVGARLSRLLIPLIFGTRR